MFDPSKLMFQFGIVIIFILKVMFVDIVFFSYSMFGKSKRKIS